MPRLSCWFIRMALLYLAIGVVPGGLILGAKGFPTALGWAWMLLSAHIQLLIGGWLIQLALGMAYWILPRLDAGGRGRPGLAWASFGALNAGVGGSAVLLALRPFWAGWWLDWLLVTAALLQVVAFAAFVMHAWPRLRAVTPVATPRPRAPAQLH